VARLCEAGTQESENSIPASLVIKRTTVTDMGKKLPEKKWEGAMVTLRIGQQLPIDGAGPSTSLCDRLRSATGDVRYPVAVLVSDT